MTSARLQVDGKKKDTHEEKPFLAIASSLTRLGVDIPRRRPARELNKQTIKSTRNITSSTTQYSVNVSIWWMYSHLQNELLKRTSYLFHQFSVKEHDDLGGEDLHPHYIAIFLLPHIPLLPRFVQVGSSCQLVQRAAVTLYMLRLTKVRDQEWRRMAWVCLLQYCNAQVVEALGLEAGRMVWSTSFFLERHWNLPLKWTTDDRSEKEWDEWREVSTATYTSFRWNVVAILWKRRYHKA